MKRRQFLLQLTSLACVALLPGCAKRSPAEAAADSDVDYYTCTMHPSVHSHDPDAKCPICGMDLVPVMKKSALAPAAGMAAASGVDKPQEFTIAADRQQLIGVTYATAKRMPLRRTIRAVGLVAATPGKHWDYVSRVDGYVHTLSVASPGDSVARGQVLMDLYSPDLVSTENEFIDLLRMRANARGDQNASAERDAERLIAGARARLQQWNISDAQIDAIERAGKADEFLVLRSPFDGVVEEVPVHQGRHVAVGDHLVDIVDLSSVWVWAEFYENELPSLRAGMPVVVSSSSDPKLSIPGSIAVIDPFVDETKRTGRFRIDIENPGLRLRPGAYVDVTVDLDEGMGLTVPVEAVLPTGAHNIVFVGRGDGRLQPRFVTLGGKFGDFYEVTGGLSEGDQVVSSANFLVDAESQVQGALKSW